MPELLIAGKAADRFAFCSCCGRRSRVRPLTVRRRVSGRLETIVLCNTCRKSDSRAWRLRFEPLEA